MLRARGIVLLGGLVALTGATGLWVWQERTPLRPPPRRGDESRQGSVIEHRTGGPLVDAEIARCAECHPDACAHFADSPHARTLSRPDASELSAYLAGPPDGRRDPAPQIEGLRYDQADGRLLAVRDDPHSVIPVDWLVGSGTHGVTPVSVRSRVGGPSEGLEMHLSWYRDKGLGLTFNHEDDLGDGIRAFGRYMSPAETLRCFQCHSTGLEFDPETMRIDFASFEPGIRCDSCHRGAREHSQTDGEKVMERLSALAPEEAVRRCGDCHRNADSVPPADLVPENPRLARFASVGLPRSECFLSQDENRLDCATCHDPHTASSRDHAYFASRCASCHDAHAPRCASQPPGSDCISCHMPKVESETGVFSTDHWIRVRRDAPAPDHDTSRGTSP